MLVHLPDGHTAEELIDGLLATIGPSPEMLWRSLTWDQGAEIACHRQLSLATGVVVFFCEPASPWQRGSNENANGLLRQYFPKGTDLRRHGPEVLAAAAAELNARPREVLEWQTPDHVMGLLGRRPAPPAPPALP